MSLAIEAFVENARGFCTWVESEKHDVPTVRQLLLALLQGVPYLMTQSGPEEGLEYPRRGHEACKAIISDSPTFPYNITGRYSLLATWTRTLPSPEMFTTIWLTFTPTSGMGCRLWMAATEFTLCATGASRIFSIGGTTPRQRFTIDEYYRRSQNDEKTA
jgi:hypothetical protein